MEHERDDAAVSLFAGWLAGWWVTPLEARNTVLGVEHEPRVAFRARWTGRHREVLVRTEPADPVRGAKAGTPDPGAIDLWTPASPDTLRAQTARVCACPTCAGDKQVTCPQCSGTREVACDRCRGEGHHRSERTDKLIRCRSCGGDGRKRCQACSKGKVRCRACDAKGCVTAWLEVRERMIHHTRWAGDADLIAVLSPPGAPFERPGLRVSTLSAGPPEATPPPTRRALDAYPALAAQPAPDERMHHLEVHRVETTVSSVRFALAGLTREVRVLADAGTVVDDPTCYEPGRLRLVLIAGSALLGAFAAAAVAGRYRAAHPWFSASPNAANLDRLTLLMALGAAAFALVAALPGAHRGRRAADPALAPRSVAAKITTQFVSGGPSVAHARERLIAGDVAAAAREAEAAADLGVDPGAATALLDELASAAVASELDPVACWRRAQRPWGDPGQRGNAEQTCFNRTLSRIEANHAAGDFTSTGALVGAMLPPWFQREDVRRLDTAASRALFDACVTANDTACAKAWLDAISLSGTHDDDLAARHHADQIGHRRIDADWSAVSKRKGPLDDRAKRCATIRPVVDLLAVVGSPAQAPTADAVVTACAKVQTDLKAAQQREAEAAARARAAAEASAARRARTYERAASSGRLRCNDGTLSPTCSCGGSRRGCCSHHGGVAGCD